MHETALMQNLIGIVNRQVREHHAGPVKKITLAVGKLSNAMPDALSFAFEAMTKSGPLKGAVLEMKEIPVAAHCDLCGAEYQPEQFPFFCPMCSSPYYTITRGEEVYVESLVCETKGSVKKEDE